MDRGLLAEFESGIDCAQAIAKLKEQGYRKLDAHTPLFLPFDAVLLGRLNRVEKQVQYNLT